MDPEKLASLKRVLGNIKGAARGFKRDDMKARLAGPPNPAAMPGDDEPDPLDPNEPAEMAAGEPPEDMDAAAKLEAIKQLLGV